jgi:hypothetical protein
MYRGIRKAQENLQSPCRARSNVLKTKRENHIRTEGKEVWSDRRKKKKLVRRKKNEMKKGKNHPNASDKSTNCTTS